MKRYFRLAHFLIATSALLAAFAGAASGREPVKLRVLFLGNSYTYFNNLPQLVAGLSLAAGQEKTLETEMVTIGGATLKILWEDGGALRAIKKHKWDYVVLQEQSTLGPSPVVDGSPQINDPQVFYEYARRFDAELKKAGTKTIFYLTWARQNRPETQAVLTAAYQSIGQELKAIVAPVGLAWESALKERPQLILHLPDKAHPNQCGSYLAACVFYAILFGQSPEGLPGKLAGPAVDYTGSVRGDKGHVELVNLSAADAALLQKIAWQTVQQQSKSPEHEKSGAFWDPHVLLADARHLSGRTARPKPGNESSPR